MADANEFPTPKQGDDGTKIVEKSKAGEASTSRGKEVDTEIKDDDGSTAKEEEDPVIEATMADANEFPTPKQGDDRAKIVEKSNAGEASTSRGKEVDAEIKDDDGSRDGRRYNDWARSINEKCDGLERSNERTIPKIPIVPQQHRRGDNEASEPRFISIGPNHRGNPRLQRMENLKLACMRQLLNPRSLVQCLCKIEAMEPRARSCYSENIDLKSKEFVEMMLMDGCFIVFYVLKPHQVKCSSWMHDEIRNDLILLENQLPFFVVEKIYSFVTSEEDIAELVEQALSFCALVSPINTKYRPSAKCLVHDSLVHHLLHLYHWFLFSTIKDDPIEGGHIIEMTAWVTIIENHHMSSLPNTSGMTASDSTGNPAGSSSSSRVEISGLATLCQNSCSRGMLLRFLYAMISISTRLLRFMCEMISHPTRWSNFRDRLSDLLSSNSTSNYSHLKKSKCTIGNATFLEAAGIKLRKKKRMTDSIMDAEFKNGVMEITPLFIDVFTVSQFRNLIALEKSSHYLETQVIAFARFMDYIISTSKDVALLRKKGIIQHAYGSDEEVATIFNSLTSGTLEYQTPKFTKMYEAVDEYCRSKRHQWWAILRRDYFGSPWAAISLVAAVILISLTFLQTHFSIYAYFRPPPGNKS